jgi:3-hydroxybutyryl-CoA dehydratase
MSPPTSGGREVPAVVRRITQEKIQRYAEASGDFNPIHVDEEYARRSPFGGTIAHGMLVLAYMSGMMADAFGRRWLSGGRLKVRFKAPARPGDVVTASARPRGTSSAADLASAEEGALEFAVECNNERGEVLLTGNATVRGEGSGAA